MKCQILFSGKNKKNIINMPSAENAQRVVKVKLYYIRNHAIMNCVIKKIPVCYKQVFPIMYNCF